LSQGFAREIKSEVTMGKNQNNPGIQLEATEENSDEKRKRRKNNREWTRIDANKPEGKRASCRRTPINADEG
jgi:hypothetical protein